MCVLCENKLGLFGAKNGPKLQIRETFTAASKIKWLVILRILEIDCKLWSEKAKNMVLR